MLLWLIPSIASHAQNISSTKEEIPTEIQTACNKYGKEYGIKPELLEAVCWQESRYQEDVVDKSKTCFGLMQIKASCHKDRMQRLGVIDLFDIDSNIHVGADILAELSEDYDEEVVLMLYHGEKNAIEKGKRGKVSDYAMDILSMSKALEELHKGEKSNDYIRKLNCRK
jgi:soluble lytic murein transglycosylase-like protein